MRALRAYTTATIALLGLCPPSHAQQGYLVAPAHGGADRGAVISYDSGRVAEKDIVLAVSRLLVDSLHTKRLPSKLTREDDDRLAAWEALSTADSSVITVFLHTSGYPDGERRGGRIFYCAEDWRSYGVAHLISIHLGELKISYELLAAVGLPRQEVCSTAGPAVSIGIGALTNADEASVILSPAFQQEFAGLLSRALASHAVGETT